MRQALAALLALFALTALAPAQAAAEEVADEIVVWGDLFARWDDTRWFVETEIGLPYALKLAADDNFEVRTNGLLIRAVIACSKEWKLGRRKYEVDCVLEDVGIQASLTREERKEKRVEIGQDIIDQIDAKLTGSKLQLQVADDGRVTGVDLEGVPKQNRRQSQMAETLRQIMSRVVVGFDMKLRKYNQLHEGKWVEYNTALMSMPSPTSTATMGSSMLVHYLNRYQGHVLVQSIGKGLITANAEGATPVNYSTDLIGVSIFDADEGFMTERVWALEGQSTAASFFTTGNYWHAGRITMLGEKDQPNCQATAVISPRGESIAGLPEWVSIER